MLRGALAAVAVVAFSAGPAYQISGQLLPPGRASVSLYGVTSPFAAATLSDDSGRFSLKGLPAGTYTLAVFIPARGEARFTVEVGPGAADPRRRISLTLRLKESDFQSPGPLRRRNSVSVSQLAVPEKARREYLEARKDLARPDVNSAVKHLELALELAPRFSEAWNELGTIAYQTRQFPRAEECFRKALEGDPEAFEPLVNLGGVLIELRKLDEAIDYNLHAMLTRPNDALANAQLGITYFELDRFELARKYLERARQLDAGHFSHPQLFLAEIHLRLNEPQAAAGELEDFLKHHPDYPQAAKVREKIAELRK